MRTFQRIFALSLALPLPALVAACSGSASVGTNPINDGAQDDAAAPVTNDASIAPDAGDTDATAVLDASIDATDAGSTQGSPHTPFPALTYEGEPLITAPKIVSITFPGDTMQPQLATFAAGATKTPWWSTTMSEYCNAKGVCIGQGTGTSIVLTTPPATTYDDNGGKLPAGSVDLQKWLTGLITAGTLPASDANTIYMIYFPSTVTVNAGGPSCSDFDGYHSMTPKGIVYSVVMECPGGGDYPAYGIDDVTLTASHEIAEAATDGIFDDQTGAGGFTVDYNDPNTWPWIDESDTEVADMCDDYLYLGQDHWVESGVTYSRIWSQKAASAGKNPCLPVPQGEVYFNAAPETSFLELNVGESLTVEVDAFTDGLTAPWNLFVESTPYVTLAFEGGTVGKGTQGPTSTISVNDGTKAKLTVTLVKDPSAGQTGPNSFFGLTGAGEADVFLWSYVGSNFANATAGHYWPMAVMARASAMDAGVTLEDGAIPEVLHARALPKRTLSTKPGSRIKRVNHGRSATFRQH